MVEVVQVPMYRAADGSLHTTRETAERHEAVRLVDEILDSLGVGKGGAWDADMISSALVDCAEDFAPAFWALAPVFRARVAETFR